MTVLKPRTRLISFRLSDEEYRELAGLCESRGARSLSEFLRSALLKLAGGSRAGGDAAVASEVQRLRKLVKALNNRVNGLSKQIQTAPGAADPASPSRNAAGGS